MTDDREWQDFDGFPGFEEPNFTKVPDVMFDKIMSKLKGSELKVLLYVFRQTFGWRKRIDDISFDHFSEGKSGDQDEGTGLARGTVSEALQSLEKKGLIVITRRRDEKHRQAVSRYKVRFREQAEYDNQTLKTVPTRDSRTRDKDENERDSSSSSAIDNNGTALALAAEFAPEENPQAIVKYLDRFPNGLLDQAAVITRQSANAKNPIAYLYGVVQRLAEQESVKPLAQQRGEVLPELSEAEYAASLEALDRVKQAL